MGEGGEGLSNNDPEEVISTDEIRERLIGTIATHFNDEKKSMNKFLDSRINSLLQTIQDMKISEWEQEKEEPLMERMINLGLFPSFSFPLDVATFEVKGTKFRPGKRKAEEYYFARTSQDLKVALSEFQPGKRLTLNKQTYLVEGIGVSHSKNPVNQMESFEFHKPRYDYETGELYPGARDWKYFHRCTQEGCGYIIGNTQPDWNLTDNEDCPACKVTSSNNSETIRSTRLHRPEVFRPKLIPFYPDEAQYIYSLEKKQNLNIREMRAPEDSEETSKPTRVGRPTLPTPLTGSIGDEGFKPIDFETNWRGVTAYRFNDSDYGIESTLEGEGSQSKSTELLVVNAGPSNDGYRICSSCGYVHLESTDKASHHRPYAIDRQKVKIYARQLVMEQLEKLIEEWAEETDTDKKEKLQRKVEKFEENFEKNVDDKFDKLWEEATSTCSGQITKLENETKICLGTTYRTDIFLLRIEIKPPITSEWNSPAFDAGFRSIKEALITEATEVLELVNREISGNMRKVVDTHPEDPEQQSYFMDLYLFDNASGGAGLVKEITSDKIMQILRRVKIRLSGEKCTTKKGCGRVCIGCLLDFRNQMESDRMDRKLGYQILSYLSGDSQTIDFRIIGGELIDDELQTKLDEETIEKEVENLSTIYTNLSFKPTGERTFTVDNGEKNGNRKVYLYSSLEAYDQLPDNPVKYDATSTYYSNLHEIVVSMPYELLRDAPHVLMNSLYPEDEDDDEDEDWTLGAPE